MPAGFESFVARRYLRAKRKEAVVSVVTVISVIGVAAGVMALVIALAVNNGFSNELEKNLLSATADVDVLEKDTANGIENWEALTARLQKLPHVTGVTPALFAQVFFQGPALASGGILKGIDVDSELRVTDTLKHLQAGSVDALRNVSNPPGLIMGSGLARNTGMTMNSRITVMSQGVLTPFGMNPNIRHFRIVGIFSTGFPQYDDVRAFTSLKAAQQALSLPDVVNEIELKLDDLNRAPEVTREVQKVLNRHLVATNWMEENRPLLNAFKMEKVVTFITIGLILFVAALNILISLVMMVMEKYRDIAVLMSMGARRNQIRKIFMLQGVLIGITGTVIGLVVGYTLCYFANRYRWISLDAQVYALSYVPFEPRAWDGAWVAAVAVLISFLATIYPARSASRLAPTEVLRYE